MRSLSIAVLLALLLGTAYVLVGHRMFGPQPIPFTSIFGAPGIPDDRERLPELALRLAWNGDGTQLIARQEDGTITAWDIRTGQGAAIAQTRALFAYCSSGDRLVVNTADAAVLLSLADGGFRKLSDGRHDHAAFSSDCSTLAIAREDEARIRVWRPDSPWQSVPTTQPVRNSLMLSADARFLAAAGGTYSETDGHRTALELFALTPERAERTVSLANPDEILGMWSMAFSPDGQGLLLGSQVFGQSGLRHIETASGNVRWGHDGFASYWVRAIAVSPDGILLATGDEEGYLRLWDLDTGTRLAEYRSNLVIQSLAFSADGRTLAVGLWDGTIGLAAVKTLLNL